MKKFLKEQVFTWAIGLILGFMGGGFAGYWWLTPMLNVEPTGSSATYGEDINLGSIIVYLAAVFFGSGIGGTIGALIGAILLHYIGKRLIVVRKD